MSDPLKGLQAGFLEIVKDNDKIAFRVLRAVVKLINHSKKQFVTP